MIIRTTSSAIKTNVSLMLDTPVSKYNEYVRYSLMSAHRHPSENNFVSAYLNGVPVGLFLITQRDLGIIYVLPEYRGRGVGRQMMKTMNVQRPSYHDDIKGVTDATDMSLVRFWTHYAVDPGRSFQELIGHIERSGQTVKRLLQKARSEIISNP